MIFPKHYVFNKKNNSFLPNNSIQQQQQLNLIHTQTMIWH